MRRSAPSTTGDRDAVVEEMGAAVIGEMGAAATDGVTAVVVGSVLDSDDCG